MRSTLRKALLVLGGLGLVGWYWYYTWIIGRACAEAGIPGEDCAFVFPWELNLQEVTTMLIVPGFLATLPFLLVFMLGGGSMRRTPPVPQHGNDPDSDR
ncbi:MAG: hypothetical protein AAGA28_13065 [Pseudomonadota bacterium]